MSRRESIRRACRESATPEEFDLQQLLHPAGAYCHPRDVLRDTDLTLNEKRAVLASWASDASAVPSKPAMRRLPTTDRPVLFEEVMEALRALDRLAGGGAQARPKKRLANQSPWQWPRGEDGKREARI